MAKAQKDLKKPVDGGEQEAVLNLFRTSNRIELRFARLFAQHSLTTSQYNILRILRSEGKPMPCLEIAERTVVKVPGITGLIDRLESAGLVLRKRSDEDRRVVNVEITAAGKKVLGELDDPIAALHQQVLGHLSEVEVAELNRLLEKARQGGVE